MDGETFHIPVVKLDDFVTAGNINETRTLYLDSGTYVNEDSLLDPNGVTDIEDIDEDATISNSEARRLYEESCHDGHIRVTTVTVKISIGSNAITVPLPDTPYDGQPSYPRKWPSAQ